MVKAPRIMLQPARIMLKAPRTMVKAPRIMRKAPNKMPFDHLRQQWLSILMCSVSCEDTDQLSYHGSSPNNHYIAYMNKSFRHVNTKMDLCILLRVAKSTLDLS